MPEEQIQPEAIPEPLRVLAAIAGILALVAILRLPYGYYRLVRLAVFGGGLDEQARGGAVRNDFQPTPFS